MQQRTGRWRQEMSGAAATGVGNPAAGLRCAPAAPHVAVPAPPMVTAAVAAGCPAAGAAAAGAGGGEGQPTAAVCPG